MADYIGNLSLFAFVWGLGEIFKTDHLMRPSPGGLLGLPLQARGLEGEGQVPQHSKGRSYKSQNRLEIVQQKTPIFFFFNW